MNRSTENSFWEKQRNGKWRTLTESLSQDSEIHSRFDNLITDFYWNFRQQKGIPQGTYNPEIDFQGFKGFEDFPKETKMGHCMNEVDIKTTWQTVNGKKVEGSEKKTYLGKAHIVLNQKFLLDRLGMDKFYSSENSYLPVGFDELIDTIAHELAHAHQFTMRLTSEEKEKSQCESTGDKNKYPESRTYCSD